MGAVAAYFNRANKPHGMFHVVLKLAMKPRQGGAVQKAVVGAPRDGQYLGRVNLIVAIFVVIDKPRQRLDATQGAHGEGGRRQHGLHVRAAGRHGPNVAQTKGGVLQILRGKFGVCRSGTLLESIQFHLNVVHGFQLALLEDGHHEPARRVHGDANVVVAPNLEFAVFHAVHDGVDGRVVLQGGAHRLDEQGQDGDFDILSPFAAELFNSRRHSSNRLQTISSPKPMCGVCSAAVMVLTMRRL